MASLTKKKTSPYWFACHTLADGRRAKRSTKQIYERINGARLLECGGTERDSAEMVAPQARPRNEAEGCF